MSSQAVPFVHLGARSEVSFGESIARVEELCWEASRDEQGFLGLTDVNSLGRAPAFAAAASRSGLKPVIGAEVNVLPFAERQYRGVVYRVRLLVEDVLGWRNLVRLVNGARGNESSSRPAFTTFAQLLQDPRGLLFFLGGERGELTRLIAEEDYERAEEMVGALSEGGILDRCFLEIPPFENDKEKALARQVHAAARHFQLLPVAVPKVSCAHAADDPIYRLLTRSGNDAPPRRLADILRAPEQRTHLHSRRLVQQRYAEFPDALEVTLEIAQHCAKFAIPQPDRRFPIHDFRRGVDAESFIWNTAFAKATERYGDLPTRYKERLDREFREIVDAGLANAVVTTTRLTEEMEAAGVQRGPGGGLFTNSLVASLLGLTRLDPLKFDLNFEIPPGLMAGQFPLLELSVPENQQVEAVDALQRLFDGQVLPVGEWKRWTARQAAEHVATLLGRDGKWTNYTLRQTMYQKARETALSQPATHLPIPEAALESADTFAWLVARIEGRVKELALQAGHYTFSVEPITHCVPHRMLALEGGRGLPLSEWTSEELGKLRHGRIAFIHSPLLDLIGEATALAREQGDLDFAPEQTAPDDPLSYKLLREGRTVGILPLEAPHLRRRMRQGQPSDLHSLIRILRTDDGAAPEARLDFPTILLCHVCAAIKARHPLAFYAAVLSQAHSDPRRMGQLLEEVRAQGIRLEPLHINYSFWRWTVERNALRPGFLTVRGMTATAGEEIMRKRRELHFADLTELCRRTDKSLLKANQLRSLLQAGAFDGWDTPRHTLQKQLEELFPLLRPTRGGASVDEGFSFFDQDASWWVKQYGMPDPSEAVHETPEELMAQEAEALCFPLRELTPVNEETFLKGARVREVARLSLKEAGSLATIVGVVGPLDGDARLPGAVLADVGGCLVRAGGTLAERLSSPNFAGRRVLLTGLIERESFQWRMDLQSITSISDAMERWATAESLTLDLARVPEENLKPLLALLKRFPGSTPVTMEWLPAEAPRVLRSIARRHVLVCPLLEEGLNRYATGRWKVSYNKDGTLRQQSRLEALAARIGLGDLRKFLPS